ncbi:hypothetical protein PanWU01x14_209720, partial [Parasponia andersonii]
MLKLFSPATAAHYLHWPDVPPHTEEQLLTKPTLSTMLKAELQRRSYKPPKIRSLADIFSHWSSVGPSFNSLLVSLDSSRRCRHFSTSL